MDMKPRQFMVVMQDICYKCVPGEKSLYPRTKSPGRGKFSWDGVQNFESPVQTNWKQWKFPPENATAGGWNKYLQLSYERKSSDKEAWAIENIRLSTILLKKQL